MNRKELKEFRWLAGMAPLVEKTDDTKAEVVEEAVELPLEPKLETIEVVPNAEMTEDLMEAAPEGLAKFLQLSGMELSESYEHQYLGRDVHPTDPNKFREVHRRVASGDGDYSKSRPVSYSHTNKNRADHPEYKDIPEHGDEQRFPDHGEDRSKDGKWNRG